MMNKAFDKILDMLEATRYIAQDDSVAELIRTRIWNKALHKAKQIVQEVAEEYNVGWIACSERLPEDDSICIVTVEYPNNETVVDYGWFDRKSVCWFVGMQEFRTSNILAWQPLPEPFKDRD